MRRITTTVLMLGVIGCGACGGPSEPTGEPSAAQQQAETGAEAARRQAMQEKQGAAEAARGRLEAVRREVAALRSQAGPVLSKLDRGLLASIENLESRIDEAQRATERFADAGPDGWERAHAEVSRTLDDLEESIGRISSEMEGQKQVLEQRRVEGPRSFTGLVAGLDGGNYDPYRVSVVRDVQRALEERGYYPGPADGYLGGPTMDALGRFQQDHGLARSGVPSPKTRERLLAE